MATGKVIGRIKTLEGILTKGDLTTEERKCLQNIIEHLKEATKGNYTYLVEMDLKTYLDYNSFIDKKLKT